MDVWLVIGLWVVLGIGIYGVAWHTSPQVRGEPLYPEKEDDGE